MNEKIKHLEEGKILLELSCRIYSVDAITSTAYKFTDECHILIQPVNEEVTGVYFTMKENLANKLEKTVNNFCNELIDQQVRINAEKEFKDIRDAIVKKAFSSIDR